MALVYPTSLGRKGMIGRPTSFPILPVGGGAFVGALDGIANLVHLYCIVRRWLSAYEGRLARLRRSSDSVEADFTYDADGNLDVAAIAAWAGGSSFVVVVADQVSGDDVSQATAGSQPLFVASGQNGHSIGRYNGASQWMRSANSFARTQPETVFAAAVVTATGIRSITDSVAAVNNFRLFSDPPTWAHVTMFSGAGLQNSAVALGNPFIASCVFNGASSKLVVNGTSQAGNAGANAANGISIGRSGGAGQNFLTGDIFFVCVCDAVLSDGNISTVQNALDNYWDIIP